LRGTAHTAQTSEKTRDRRRKHAHARTHTDISVCHPDAANVWPQRLRRAVSVPCQLGFEKARVAAQREVEAEAGARPECSEWRCCCCRSQRAPGAPERALAPLAPTRYPIDERPRPRMSLQKPAARCRCRLPHLCALAHTQKPAAPAACASTPALSSLPLTNHLLSPCCHAVAKKPRGWTRVFFPSHQPADSGLWWWPRECQQNRAVLCGLNMVFKLPYQIVTFLGCLSGCVAHFGLLMPSVVRPPESCVPEISGLWNYCSFVSNKMPNYDFTVVGAGRMGASIAGHLVLQGARVALFDRSDFDRCASRLRPCAARPAGLASCPQARRLAAA
jgi:hypothetical protein